MTAATLTELEREMLAALKVSVKWAPSPGMRDVVRAIIDKAEGR